MELDNENIELNIKKPTDYVNRLEELNGGVNILLDEFKKVYIIARMHPNNEDIQERYQNMISNLNQLQSKLFSTSNDIQVNIDDINKKMIELDLFIKEERKINKKLKISN